MCILGAGAALPLAGRVAPYHHPPPANPKEVVMAKGQMRVPKEKKKPKADKDKPKHISAYKLAQTQGSPASPYSHPPKKT
jgi:hypothetical protein